MTKGPILKIRKKWLLRTLVPPLMAWIILSLLFDTSSRKPIDRQKHQQRENACFVMLARNSELEGILHSIRYLEKSFNHKRHYPYVLLNDVEFSEEVKAAVLSHVSSSVAFGLVPVEHWRVPAHLNMTLVDERMQGLHEEGVMYANSLTYRQMCRYFSGFFHRHPLLQQYDYYWRVEPSVDFPCEIADDPFLQMRKNGYKYGFTFTLKESMATIPTLGETALAFAEEHPEFIHPNNIMGKFFDEQGYNGCHFWSNFEIGDFRFLRSEAYMRFFEHLDRTGAFFYERWGDAPVHSIAASMFLDQNDIHYFDDISYKHDYFRHCPINHRSSFCWCTESHDFIDFCLANWLK